MNTDEIVRADVAIIVTTTKFVILTSDAVADALTVIKMQNVMKVSYLMHRFVVEKKKGKQLYKRNHGNN